MSHHVYLGSLVLAAIILFPLGFWFGQLNVEYYKNNQKHDTIHDTAYVICTEFSACKEGLITPYGDTVPYPKRKK